MSRPVPFDEAAFCAACGKRGVFDIMGDARCPACAAAMFDAVPTPQQKDEFWAGRNSDKVGKLCRRLGLLAGADPGAQRDWLLDRIAAGEPVTAEAIDAEYLAWVGKHRHRAVRVRAHSRRA